MPKFNNKNFLDFLDDFDSINHKFDLTHLPQNNTRGNSLTDLYLNLADEESKTHMFDLKDHDYSEIYDNLKLIYGELEDIDEFVHIYALIHEKIIGKYLNIEGLDKLYNQNYFNFEWEMHMGIDYEKQRHRFYRDHFIHQVRDLYEMCVFLDNFKLIENAIEILFPDKKMGIHISNDTSIAKYIARMATMTIDAIMKNLTKDNSDSHISTYAKIRDFMPKKVDFDKWLENNIVKNIIRSASYIAALFHDIGYPVEFVLRRRKHIADFLPNIHYFTETEGHFDKICAQLKNSLLFTIVSNDEIQKKYNEENNAHGVISALALLLYYYENGTIYSLAPDKRAAIELAAITIYDHTINPQYYAEKNKDSSYYRLLFYMNPISYLFRLCDDMQEWERIYFTVDGNSHLRICHKCKTPLMRIPINIDQLLNKEPNMEEKYIDFYRIIKDKRDIKVDMCACYATEEDFKAKIAKLLSNGFNSEETSEMFIELDDTEFRREADIQHRKIHHIKTCHNINIQCDDCVDETADDSDDLTELEKPPKKMMFDIEYAPYKLLQMSFIDPDFAEHRREGIVQLKKLLEMQNGFPRTIVKSEITTNPIILKINILRDFIMSIQKCKKPPNSIKKLTLASYIKKYFFTKEENILKNKVGLIRIYESISKQIYKCDKIRECINKQLKFYVDLLVWGEKFKEYKEKNETSIKKIKKRLEKTYPNYYGKNIRLIDDYLLNRMREKIIAYDVLHYETDKALPDEYYDIYKMDDRLLDAIKQFTSESRYDPFVADTKPGLDTKSNIATNSELDAYIDIYFFKVLDNYKYTEYPEDSTLKEN